MTQSNRPETFHPGVTNCRVLVRAIDMTSSELSVMVAGKYCMMVCAVQQWNGSICHGPTDSDGGTADNVAVVGFCGRFV